MADYLKIARAALATAPTAECAELERALLLLNRTSTRIMGDTIGVWSDLDSFELRRALRIVGMDQLPIRYLDGAHVPSEFKLRRVCGEPVPLGVLAAMEANAASPFTVRDRLLKEVGWKR